MDEAILVIGAIFLFFGMILGVATHSETKQRECRIELAKELKLDPANILLICEGK